ncbi:MAG: bacterial transcriptional activator domain-containing protein [Actinomycetota bacterium]
MTGCIANRFPKRFGSTVDVGSSTVVVRILGPVRIPGLGRPLTSQQLSLVTRLAAVGPAGRERLVDDLWDGRPVSAGRVANVVAEVRSVLGPGRLPEARFGHYALQGVTTDLELLIAAAAEPPERGVGGDRLRLARLASVLDLVAGPILATPGDRWWHWVDSHPELVARGEVAVARVTVELATGLVADGRLRPAQAACERALAACPHDEQVLGVIEDVLRRQRRPGAADGVARRRGRRLARLDGLLADGGPA